MGSIIARSCIPIPGQINKPLKCKVKSNCKSSCCGSSNKETAKKEPEKEEDILEIKRVRPLKLDNWII